MPILLKIPKELSMSTKSCASLWILFIILQLSMLCVTDALKNSRHHRTNHRQAIDNPATSQPSEIAEAITRENIHLYALIGHHFNRSLIEEIKHFDPNLISEHQKIKVCFLNLLSRSPPRSRATLAIKSRHTVLAYSALLHLPTSISSGHSRATLCIVVRSMIRYI